MSLSLSKAGPDFARRVGRIATSVDKGRKETLRQAGMVGKKEHADLLRRDSGGDSRLSGVGKRGARIGARFDMVGEGAVAVKATGPVHFLANPMSPHRIPRQRARGRRRVVVIPGVGVRAYANHPGTPGKDSWNRAVPEARRKVAKVMLNEYGNIIRSALR